MYIKYKSNNIIFLTKKYVVCEWGVWVPGVFTFREVPWVWPLAKGIPTAKTAMDIVKKIRAILNGFVSLMWLCLFLTVGVYLYPCCIWGPKISTGIIFTRNMYSIFIHMGMVSNLDILSRKTSENCRNQTHIFQTISSFHSVIPSLIFFYISYPRIDILCVPINANGIFYVLLAITEKNDG